MNYKKTNIIKAEKASDFMVEFIKKYIINNLNITKPIDVSILCDIEDQLYAFEDDNYTDDGTKKPVEYSNFERNNQASLVLAELLKIWENSDIDYEDLNKRLGFI